MLNLLDVIAGKCFHFVGWLVCLLTTLLKIFCMNVHEIFASGRPGAREQLIRFWG